MISSMIGTSKLASDAVNDSINLPDIVSRKATATSASGTATTTTIHGNHGNPIYSSAIKLCQTAKKHK